TPSPLRRGAARCLSPRPATVKGWNSNKETFIAPLQTIWFSLASHSASWRGVWSSLEISGRNFGRQRILLVAASPEELRDLEAALKKGHKTTGKLVLVP